MTIKNGSLVRRKPSTYNPFWEFMSGRLGNPTNHIYKVKGLQAIDTEGGLCVDPKHDFRLCSTGKTPVIMDIRNFEPASRWDYIKQTVAGWFK